MSTGRRQGRAWVVYMLRCADGTFYVGSTNDLEARVRAHDAGRGAKYTRGRGPVTVVYRRWCVTQSRALSLEAIMKRLDRRRRLLLAAGDPAVKRDVLARLRRRTAPKGRGQGDVSTRRRGS